jgi:hypothetical protein
VTAVPFSGPGAVSRLRFSAFRRARALLSAAVTPYRASLLRLLDMPLAVLGTGLVDWAAFHVDQGAGLLVTGLSLWLVEHLIADDDTNGTA